MEIPSGVEVKVDGRKVFVKGPKGELSLETHERAAVKLEDSVVTVSVPDEEDGKDRALWGLTRRLIGNMVQGVTVGFEKKLEVSGVGFKVAMQGKELKLDVGYSHSILFPVPEGIGISVEKNVITVSGIDKQKVGDTAAQIRKTRKPEPYKGKGIKYLGEEIQRKAGKAAKTAA